MSEYSMSDAAIRQAFAEIDRTQAETRKLLAEQTKLMRERTVMPLQVMISGLAAGGALVGGTVALMRILGG